MVTDGSATSRLLSPEQATAFVGLVRAGETLARQLDAELQSAHGLGLRGFEVLLFLAAFSEDGRLRMTELTQRAPLSQSRVSRLVAELEARGFVERAAAEEDARGVDVAITEHGREVFAAAQETHRRGLDARLFEPLSRDQVRALGAIARKILEACGTPL